ncbi:MAG TPA: RIP metalloprotease RseP [Pyrinomonadaceae bacterium]|nr:RIP metalloprotease RseP [Pyrinomonadaceae bacterium]
MNLIGLLAFIFILGAAVVLHEFGHFIVAKLFKMRVETFSVGFGPRLFGRRFGTTDYRVSLIPLGGYVKLGGDESNAAVEGAGESDIPANERFDLRPRWQKFLVMVAGPTMNILTALTVFWVGAMIMGVPAAPTSPVIRYTKPGGVSEAAGLRAGDRIVSFNGKDNPSWDRIRGDVSLSPEQPLPMIVERNGERVALTLTPARYVEEGESIGDVDFRLDYGELPVYVTEVIAGSPAEASGLKVNDRVLAVNGEQVRDEFDVRAFIQSHPNEQVRLKVERNGQQQELTANVSAEGKIGFAPASVLPQQRVGPVAALGHSVNRNLEILRMTGAAFAQIFRGQRSARESLSGPIGIARASSTAANKLGWAGVFTMLGFLSLNLGIVNLLPIPVLDGGAIFLLFIEAMLGWIGVRMSMTVRERIQQVGMVMLLLLMGFVITNDLLKEASRFRSSDDKPPAAAQPAK